MKKIFLSLIIIGIFLCCSEKKNNYPLLSIDHFPINGKLTAQIQQIPPIAMSPHRLFITNEYLLFYNTQKDTLFDIFRLPDLTLLYSAGIKGQGPQDFYDLERRMFEPTAKGFKVFSQPDRKIKEVFVSDSGLWVDNDNAITYKIDETPLNGVLPVKDSTLIYWGGVESEKEYVLFDTQEGSRTFSSYPAWGNNQREELPIFTYVKNSILNADHTRFISFYGYFKRFRIHSVEGKLLTEVTVQTPPYEDKLAENPLDRTVYYFTPPRTDGNYIYILCKNSTRTEEKAPELQIWNWEGEPVARYELDRPLTLFDISATRHKLYAVDGEHEDEIYVYDLPTI